MIHLLLTNVERRDRVLKALAPVCGGKLKTEWDGHTVPILVGNNKGMDEVQRQCIAKKIPYVTVDHAYFNRHPDLKWFRLCVNGYHCNDWRDSERKCAVKVKEWRKDGRNIVVIRPAAMVGTIHPVSEWFDHTMATLREVTDRKVIIKEKGVGALSDALTDAFAVVCFGSVADVDAVRMGIPAFCSPYSPVYPVAQHDVRLIETPIYPDRAKWLRSLAASEWKLDEISQAWERVSPCLSVLMQNYRPQ